MDWACVDVKWCRFERFFCQIKHINFSKWQLECKTHLMLLYGVRIAQWKHLYPIRTSCCMQTFNQRSKGHGLKFWFPYFLWQNNQFPLKLNPVPSQSICQRRWREKQQHFPLFRSFCDCCMLLYILCCTCRCFFPFCWYISVQTQCARAQSILLSLLCMCNVRVCVCVKIISKVICWRNVISRQNSETNVVNKSETYMYMYIEWMNERTHLQMRFAMAIFVWHASFCCSNHYITAESMCLTEFWIHWLFSVPCNPNHEQTHAKRTQRPNTLHIENGKWKMEHTHTNIKWNKSKLRCCFW